MEPVHTDALPELPPVVVEQDGAGEVRELRELTLVLSGELRGEIEPCGCPTLPFGGFERRHRLLHELEARSTPTFQLDVGQAFQKGLVHQDGRDVPRAELISELLISGGLDVLVPGPTDLDVLGREGLAELPNVVSANWIDEGGELLFPASVVLEEDGVRVGVVGLSDTHEQVRERPVIEAARQAIAELPPDLDLVVVLSNLDGRAASEVATNVDGYGVLVTASGPSHEAPRWVGDVLVIEPPPRGRYLTIASMWLGSGPDQRLEDDDLLARRFGGILDLRDVIALRTSRDEPIDEQSAKLAASVAELSQAAAGRNVVHLDDRALGSDLDGPSSASEALATFRDRELASAADRVKSAPEHDGPTYATGASCVPCHTQQVANWGFTAHAKALQSLRTRGESDNPECVGCHTTAFGEPGGFADVSDAGLRTWGNVQCEACHGPLRGHPQRKDVAPQSVNETTCVGCHDEANSPNFDYATYLRKVACPVDPS